MDSTKFQYCQKLVVLSNDLSKVLVAKRQGEQDYNGVYAYIGGKMEHTDSTFIEGIKRERDEEVGSNFKIKLFPTYIITKEYLKKDGSYMILPHYLCIHQEGEIELNEEYSEYKWINLDELESHENLIENIPELTLKMRKEFEIINQLDSIIV